MRRTKILATLGPASSSPNVITKMVEAGIDGARLNFSHGTHADHAELAKTVRAASEKVGRPVALIQDLPGPKIRLRPLAGGELTLEEGSTIRLETSDEIADQERLTVNEGLVEQLEVGTQLLLGDGEVSLDVVEVAEGGVMARVLLGGPVRSGAGITAPNLGLPGGLTQRDREDLLFGQEIGVDYVAVSFVTSAEDVAEAKELLAAEGASIPVIAKIERRSALANIEEIARTADGILVARGDLGLALPPEEVPVAQKHLLRLCAQQGILSITASQMLETMVWSARPTRAEVSDVANAILDGSSVIMLSGETAVGVNPPRTVAIMARIAEETERAMVTGEMEEPWKRGVPEEGGQADAICHAAVGLAEELGVKAIVSFTSSGSTATRVAKYRPRMATIGATPLESTCNRLALVWGVFPYLVSDPSSLDELVQLAESAAKALRMVQAGDSLVLTAGEIGVPGTTNMIRVAIVH